MSSRSRPAITSLARAARSPADKPETLTCRSVGANRAAMRSSSTALGKDGFFSGADIFVNPAINTSAATKNFGMTPPALHGLAPPIITAVAAGKPMAFREQRAEIGSVGREGQSLPGWGWVRGLPQVFDQLSAKQNAANRSYN